MTVGIRHAPYWEQGLPTHVPFRNAGDTMLAWELYEASEIRMKLHDLEQRVFDGVTSESKAQRDLDQLLAEAGRKCAAYTKSIGKAAARLNKPAPAAPMEIRALVRDLAINDQVVCHAAMMRRTGGYCRRGASR